MAFDIREYCKERMVAEELGDCVAKAMWVVQHALEQVFHLQSQLCDVDLRQWAFEKLAALCE